MSQAGKVLHLYVEVRSVPEDEGKMPGRGDDETSHLMLQCPDILPNSQKSSAYSSRNPSPDLAPILHHTGSENHSLPPSKSSSKQSVSFQLQNSHYTGSNTQIHQRDVLHDSFGQLLEVLAPRATSPGHHGSLGHICSSDVDPHQRRGFISPSSTSSGRLTVPSTPISNRRSCEVPVVLGEEGKKSVVSFGYIEKANVHNMAGRRHSVCQNEPDNPFRGMEGKVLPPHLRKRLSDPMSYNGYPSHGDLFLSHPQNQLPRGSPYLQRTTLDAVARDATYRALEEFGSPELKRRFAGHRLENSSPTLPRHYQPPQCRSWGGSPVLPRSTLTLPSKTQLMELDKGLSRSSVNGLPRSPASDHLCAHTGYSPQSVDPVLTFHSNGPEPNKERSWMGDESPRFSSRFHPPLPAGRPTDIQHEVQTKKLLTSNSARQGSSHHSANSTYNTKISNTSHNATDSIHNSASNKQNLTSKSHYKSSHCSSRSSEVVSPVDGRRSVSPSSNIKIASKLAIEATKVSSMFAERRSPSPTPLHAENSKIRGSTLTESQPYATLHGRSSPEPSQVDNQNHSWKTDKPVAHAKPGHISPVTLQKGLASPASPAVATRLYHTSTSQLLELDPLQKRSSSPSKDMSSLHHYQPPQYTGDRKSPCMERRPYDYLFGRSPRDSPELTRKLLSNTDAEAVSWTSRQQEWKKAGSVQDRSEREENYRHSPSNVYTPSKDEYYKKYGGEKGSKTSVQEHQRLVLGMTKDLREEVQDHSGGAGMSSQSSSGVTGSLGDSSPLDRNDSLSPETSSQSSHDTADGGSGMQVGWRGGG